MDFLNKINAVEKIRDPIYGFIFLTKEECKLIDLPIFQRLRRIHQLALTKYVYPSAEHSRFVHSLGVMQAATMIFIEIFKNNEKAFEKDETEILTDLKILRFAALLHDIGHLPFSHAAEKLLLSGGKHEDLSKYIIDNDCAIKEILNENRIFYEEVSDLIIGTSSDKVLQRIISGEFDADRADYLLRDSYCCGVQYGVYDLLRYVSSFKITDSANIMIKEDNIAIIESLITARYYYNQQVIYHRTRQAYNIALRNYIAEQKEIFPRFSMKNNIDINNELLWFDDYTIIEQAKNDIQKQNSQWAKYILRLEHLKCFEQFMSETDKEVKSNLDSELMKSGFQIDKDYFQEAVKTSHHKLSESTDENDESIKYEVDTRYGRRKKNLMDYSPILRGLSQHNQMTRYFCKEKEKEKFTDIVNKINGGSNV
ncbi:MAG: HD domain-containing protein [Elusimicrobiota bacterium]|jgi:HD superfamily phosphohydrolase|nr:HD domain-containing protein [Elusimicrobiota bacterium]